MLKQTVMAALLVLACTNVCAQPKNTQPVVTQAVMASAPAPSDEVRVLKALLEAEKRHNENVLETVYWSLGFVGGITLLVVGFGWYNSKAMHDRDIRSIKSEVSLEQSEKLNKAISDLTASIRAQSEKDIADGLAAAANTTQKSIKSLAAKVKEIDFEIRFHKHETQIRYWVQRDVPANTLREHLFWLDDAKQAGDAYQIREALGGMQKWLEADAPVDAEEVPDYMAALTGLGDEFSINVQSIRRLLAQRRAR